MVRDSRLGRSSESESLSSSTTLCHGRGPTTPSFRLLLSQRVRVGGGGLSGTEGEEKQVEEQENEYEEKRIEKRFENTIKSYIKRMQVDNYKISVDKDGNLYESLMWACKARSV